MNLIIIYFALKYKGNFHDIYSAIKNKEFIPTDELMHIHGLLAKKEIQAITIIDEMYPESLKQISNPPFVLFYKGNKNLLLEKKIILTGDFNNKNIQKFLDEAVNEISKDYTFVSNCSKGIDEELVEILMKQNMNLILISPNGFINPYFSKKIDIDDQSDSILFLSECPDEVNLNRRRIVQRNRITIGLSETLILASSTKDSKLLSLVSFALEQGKDIYCYPGTQDEEDGNNLLIQDGAIMVTSIKNKNFTLK